MNCVAWSSAMSWMIQGGGSLGFLHEAAGALGIGELFGRQDLDGDEAFQAQIARLVDDTHAAFTEFFG